MPLWLIYHPPGTFETPCDKQAFVTDITSIYTGRGLPPFYVNVNFVKTDPSNMFVGGKPATHPFIRIVIKHIAIVQPDQDEAYKKVREKIHAVIKPHVFDKGWDSEFHVEETERRMWEIAGLVPPPFQSAEEKVWAESNKPTPY